MKTARVIGLLGIFLIQTVILTGLVPGHVHTAIVSSAEHDAFRSHDCGPVERHRGLDETETCLFCLRTAHSFLDAASTPGLLLPPIVCSIEPIAPRIPLPCIDSETNPRRGPPVSLS